MVMADVERLFATRARFDAETLDARSSSSTRPTTASRCSAGRSPPSSPNRRRDTRLHFRPLSDELIAGADDALRNVDGFVLPLGFVEGLPHLAAYQDRWVLLVDRDNDARR